MKKAIALSVLAVMLLTALCACSSVKKDLIGTWSSGEGLLASKLTFNKDGTGKQNELIDFTWELNDDKTKVTVTQTVLGEPIELVYTINGSGDDMKLINDDTTYTKN